MPICSYEVRSLVLRRPLLICPEMLGFFEQLDNVKQGF